MVLIIVVGLLATCDQVPGTVPEPYVYFSFDLFLKFILFLAVLGLHCYTRAFSSCSNRGWGLLSICGAQASHCRGFSCRARALGMQASVIVVCGLSFLTFDLQSTG